MNRKTVAFGKMITTVSMLLLLFGTAIAQGNDCKDPYCAVDHSVRNLYMKVQINKNDPMSLRWADDDWDTNDKLDHLAGGMVTMSITTILWTPHTSGDVWQRAGINAIAWILYEAKDGLWDWTPSRTWGGEGASYKDATLSILGVGLITAVVFAVK